MPNQELQQLLHRELQQLLQLQLPTADPPWSPVLPSAVTREDYSIGLVGLGAAPALPAQDEDLSTWTLKYPAPGSAPGSAPEAPVEVEEGGRLVRFYRRVSRGSAAARFDRPLNNGRFYWELLLGDRIFGTAIMVGVGTPAVRDHTEAYRNLIGEDDQGWGLSHKGIVWHDGYWSPYTQPFPQNESTIIGVLFDGVAGTLGFFRDGRWLGVAFTGLDKVRLPLYPMMASTARNTKMRLLRVRRDLGSLAERCRACVLRRLADPARDIRGLPLPGPLRAYLLEGVVCPVSLPTTNPAHRLLI